MQRCLFTLLIRQHSECLEMPLTARPRTCHIAYMPALFRTSSRVLSELILKSSLQYSNSLFPHRNSLMYYEQYMRSSKSKVIPFHSNKHIIYIKSVNLCQVQSRSVYLDCFYSQVSTIPHSWFNQSYSKHSGQSYK